MTDSEKLAHVLVAHSSGLHNHIRLDLPDCTTTKYYDAKVRLGRFQTWNRVFVNSTGTTCVLGSDEWLFQILGRTDTIPKGCRKRTSAFTSRQLGRVPDLSIFSPTAEEPWTNPYSFWLASSSSHLYYAWLKSTYSIYVSWIPTFSFLSLVFNSYLTRDPKSKFVIEKTQV